MTWRPTLRIAARDARRAKARSILVVAMIGLPVLALGFADVMWRTSVPNADERLARELGTSQALVVMQAAPHSGLIQTADPRNGGFMTTGEAGAVTPDIDTLKLPAGIQMLVERQTSVGIRTRAGVAPLGWTEVDATNPAMRGRWTLREGRAPAAPGEVLLTPAMAERTDVSVGGTLELTDPAGSYEVVGIIAREGSRAELSVVAAPGTLIGQSGGIALADTYNAMGLLTGAPVTWDEVQVLNDGGAVVTSRAVLANPPATTAFDEQGGVGYGGTSTDWLFPVLIIAMVVCLAGLEVVLLAGAAFAVGARRQAHALALVSASGGSRRDLRRIVLGGGLVLGAVAGVAGVVLAVILAWGAEQAVLRWLPDFDLARFDLRPLELLLVALVGVLTGVLAALVPARQAARLDVVAALRGRSGAPPRSRRTPVIGLVMVALGVLASVLGAAWVVAMQRDSTGQRTYLPVVVLVGGAALVLLGLVVCAGTVVTIAAKIAPRLPLAGRLALRDAERHRGRSAPAVAAILAAVTGSVAVMLYVASLDEHDRLAYTPGAPAGTAVVSLLSWETNARGTSSTVTYLDPARVQAAVGSLPVSSATVMSTAAPCFDGACDQVNAQRPPANRCPVWDSLTGESTQAEVEDAQARAAQDPRCDETGSSRYWQLQLNGSIVFGGEEALVTSGRAPSQAVSSVLAAGGAVVTDPYLLDADGKVSIEYYSAKTLNEQAPPGQENTWTGPEPDRVVKVPGVVVPNDQTIAPVVASPSVAKELGLELAPTTLLLNLSADPTSDQEDAARAALSEVGTTTGESLYIERGYESSYGLGLLALAIAAAVVTLGATGIATGLALTDARADHATLAAVGAAPRLRRRLAGAQALVLGFLGVVLGIGAGMVPALSIIGATDSLSVVWPWPQLAIVLLGVPLLAGAAAFLFTRSKVPMQRRVVA